MGLSQPLIVFSCKHRILISISEREGEGGGWETDREIERDIHTKTGTE